MKNPFPIVGSVLFSLISCDSLRKAKIETEIWEELCAAATIEEGQSNYYHPTAVIPLDLYCEYLDCDANIEIYVEQFSTCDETESDWPTCAWNRRTGCNMIQFEAPCDESCSHHVAFDARTGSLLGLYYGSDSSMNVCGASDFRVGEFNDYFYKQNVCDDVEQTFCCEVD